MELLADALDEDAALRCEIRRTVQPQVSRQHDFVRIQDVRVIGQVQRDAPPLDPERVWVVGKAGEGRAVVSFAHSPSLAVDKE